MKEKQLQFVGTGETKNRITAAEPENKIITGKLTSRIESKKDYYYGFFKFPNHNQEIPVIFKGGKPNILVGSRLELEGNWANSSGVRPSFTCQAYQVLADPPRPTLKSLQNNLQPLLTTAREKKSEWQTRTDYLFKKKRDLEEIERMSKLGDQFLQAYLLTKQAFYANYQPEHLEQANFNLETYLSRIASELDRESQHIQAYQRKENK